MGQPVKLSDGLVCEARAVAESAQRSIAGQIEFWAQLGRALERLLRGDQALALRRAGAERSLATAVREVDTQTGRQRVSEYLQSQPFPHFEAIPGADGLICKIDADGIRSVGRFVNREFRPDQS
ncbi:MAG: ParD-like family protein [Planctomycetes bacterium]|nr:ParD-like family protein [Planctomycetota bacterium]